LFSANIYVNFGGSKWKLLFLSKPVRFKRGEINIPLLTDHNFLKNEDILIFKNENSAFFVSNAIEIF
jgi:hypothetical protein